jgi:hypothetical protein
VRTISKGAMLVAGVHFVALAAPSVAFAQEPAPVSSPAPVTPTTAAVQARVAAGDVIDLKNGGTLHGTLIDAVPNSYARIQLVTGQVATVPWQDIQRIERGIVTPAPVAATGPAAPAAAATAPTVWVHIEGSQVAQLQRDKSGDGDWVTVCTAPCDRALPAQVGYRIVGDGIRDSSDFELSAQAGERQTLTVDEGSRGGFVLGLVGTIAGGVAIGVGLLVVAIAALSRAVDGDNGSPTQGDANAETAGWVISGAGTAGLVGGIVLLVSNGRTRVAQGSAAAPPAAWLPSSSDWAHVAGPRDTRRDVQWVGTLPQIASVPLFGGSF